jgi:hypothetical protein
MHALSSTNPGCFRQLIVRVADGAGNVRPLTRRVALRL